MAALLLCAGFVSIISHLFIGVDDLAMRFFSAFAVLVLIVLALGQFQHAYYLLRVSHLLWRVAGNGSYNLNLAGGTKVRITYRDDWYHEVEVTDFNSLDVITYTITSRKITATKKTPAGVLMPILGEQSSDLSKMTFDEQPFSPDYKQELHRLVCALQKELPRRGRFTP